MCVFVKGMISVLRNRSRSPSLLFTRKSGNAAPAVHYVLCERGASQSRRHKRDEFTLSPGAAVKLRRGTLPDSGAPVYDLTLTD